uniref:Uncharacterized protein n=1 Tax=Opuntia streptacantha TaxID=393608 RepID=A0A7C9DXT4_OPUST
MELHHCWDRRPIDISIKKTNSKLTSISKCNSQIYSCCGFANSALTRSNSYNILNPRNLKPFSFSSWRRKALNNPRFPNVESIEPDRPLHGSPRSSPRNQAQLQREKIN